MPHPLPSNPAVCYFDAATVTDNALILGSLILSAGTLPVPLRPEYPLAEKPVLLRPVCPVVDSLWLSHLAEGPTSNIVGTCKRNLDRTVIIYPIIDIANHFISDSNNDPIKTCKSLPRPSVNLKKPLFLTAFSQVGYSNTALLSHCIARQTKEASPLRACSAPSPSTHISWSAPQRRHS